MCPHRVKNWLLIWYMPVTIWPRECRKTDDIFSFFGWCLFPPSLSFSLHSFPFTPSHSITLIPTFSFLSCSLSSSPLCNPFPPFLSSLSLTYYWKAIVFSRRRFSYGAAIFHDPILERRERGMRRRRERGERAGWQTGITGENTGAFNMQLPSTLPEGKTSRKIGGNTRASLGSRPSNSESRLMVTPGPRARGEINFQGPWHFTTRRIYRS